MSNASPIGGGGRARTRSRSVSRRRRDAPHVAHRLVRADPERFGHLPGDEIMARVRHRGRRSLRGRSREFRKWMPSSVSAQICRERPANAPAATRRPTSATEPLRAEVLLERALSADPSVTHLTGRSRVSNTLVNGLSTATLRRVSSKRVPSHLALPRSGRGPCVRPTDYLTDQPEPDVQDRTSAILTGTIDDC